MVGLCTLSKVSARTLLHTFMHITETEIKGVFIIEPRVFIDERGSFMELYNKANYSATGVEYFIQDNISTSKKGVVRGLHFQEAPHAQAKLVSVVVGEVLDVAVDLRRGSPTFGKYVAVLLSGENKKQLFIPEGFAHGFMSLSEGATLMYKCSSPWNKSAERSIRFDDLELGIAWPEGEAILSEKDSSAMTFREYKEMLGII